MKKALCFVLSVLFILTLFPAVNTLAAQREETKEPELEALQWVIDKPLEAQTFPDNWQGILSKLTTNVEALAEIMRPNLDDQRGFSPFSLYMALMAVRPGLSEETQAKLDEKLNPADLTEDELTVILRQLNSISLASANDGDPEKIWENNTFALADKSLTFHPDYLKALEDKGMAALQGDLTDEQSFADLNRLVSHYTNGLIDPIYSETEIQEKIEQGLLNILINTLYFRDSWDDEFDPSLTKEKTFFGSEGEAKVPMMFQKNIEMSYLETEDYAAFRKSYSSRSAEMVVLMPKSEVDEEEFWTMLTEAKSSSDWKVVDLTLTFPKWELSSKISLDQAVGALDLNEMIKNDPDLRYFTDPVAMEMGSAFQQVELKVNEEGTEAAVVTVLKMAVTAVPMPNPQVSLIVDHPFLYSIEVYGLPLIQGTIKDLP